MSVASEEKGVRREEEVKRKSMCSGGGESMSVTSEERMRRGEEIKRRLKSELSLPHARPLKLEKEPTIKARPAPKAKTDISTVIAEEHLPLLRLPQLKPLTIKPKPLAHGELKGMNVEEAKPLTPKAVQAPEVAKAGLKPKIPRTEAIEALKLGEVRVSTKEPSKEEMKVSLKPLRLATPKPEPITMPSIRIPSLRPPQIIPKRPTQPVLPGATEGGLAEEIEEAAEGLAKEPEFEPYSPDVFGLPEGLLNEESTGSGLLAEVSPGGFICIVVDRTRGFDKLIELLCSILFRIKGKGLPSARTQEGLVEAFSNFRLREDIQILEDLSRKLRGAVSKVKMRGDIKELEGFVRHLKELRLEQTFRYLILPADNKDDVKRIAEILKNAAFEFNYYIPKLYAYACKELSLEHWNLVLQAMFGFVGNELDALSGESSKLAIQSTSELRLDPRNIGNWCLGLDTKFYEELDRVKKDVGRRLSSQKQPRPGEEIGQSESWLHYSLKFLTVKHLIDNLKVQEEFVKTEEGLGLITPDVYVSSPREISVEVETFYGTGDPYRAKLIPKLEEYQKAGFKGELWLVVPNIQALLFVDDLLKLRRDYKGRLNVDVYTLDLTGHGAELTCGERRGPGLIRLVDVLGLLTKRDLKRPRRFLEV